MKSGLGLNGLLYADDANVLINLDEKRRIDDNDAMNLELFSRLYHTKRNVDEAVRSLDEDE